jgi:hypothetical protein
MHGTSLCKLKITSIILICYGDPHRTTCVLILACYDYFRVLVIIDKANICMVIGEHPLEVELSSPHQ